jgi:alkylation response protein AidB-like acyl-CoA dehydrogenase
MTKVAVADALFAMADPCVEVMGGTGVSGNRHCQTKCSGATMAWK